MKLIKQSIDNKSNSGTITMCPTHIDDFYMLSDVVEAGDVVEGTTTRKLSLDNGRTQQKITLTLSIKVEKTDFDFISGHMIVKGKVYKENKHVQLGVYHSIHIDIGDNFSLFKTKWGRRCFELVNKSCKNGVEICFVLFYEKECVVSVISGTNIRNVLKCENKNKNFKQIAAKIIAIRPTVKTVIIGGFGGGVVDEFQKILSKEERGLNNNGNVIKLGNEYKNISNAQVIGKLMVDKAYSRLFAEMKHVGDLVELTKFFTEFEKEASKVCVGYAEIIEACDFGAIKTLFITENLYRPTTAEAKKKIDRLITNASQRKAKICIIPINHDLGARLAQMGGISAVLLYKYK